LLLSNLAFSQGIDENLSLDGVMWENTIWNEIEEVTTKEYEVEKITTVAGVRGAEAEDEALHHLYYRQSMKGLSEIQLRKAYGKLKNKRDILQKENPIHKDLPKLNSYLKQLKYKLNNI